MLLEKVKEFSPAIQPYHDPQADPAVTFNAIYQLFSENINFFLADLNMPTPPGNNVSVFQPINMLIPVSINSAELQPIPAGNITTLFQSANMPTPVSISSSEFQSTPISIISSEFEPSPISNNSSEFQPISVNDNTAVFPPLPFEPLQPDTHSTAFSHLVSEIETVYLPLGPGFDTSYLQAVEDTSIPFSPEPFVLFSHESVTDGNQDESILIDIDCDNEVELVDNCGISEDTDMGESPEHADHRKNVNNKGLSENEDKKEGVIKSADSKGPSVSTTDSETPTVSDT